MPVGAALLVFGATEIGKHVVIRPAGIAELPPEIEILLLAADVNEAVYRARTAEHLAARPQHAAPAEFGKRLGFEDPGQLRVEYVPVKARRYVDPRVAVPATRFEQQHSRSAVRGQSIRQHAAGGTGADDDEIEFPSVLHSHSR